MVWIGFRSICCSKVAEEAKVALGCWYYKELLKTLKLAQKLPSTIYSCLFFIHFYGRKASFEFVGWRRAVTLINLIRRCPEYKHSQIAMMTKCNLKNVRRLE